MLEVLVDGGVEVFGIALVYAVDLPLLLDLHIPLSQDELADALKNTNVMFRCLIPARAYTPVVR